MADGIGRAAAMALLVFATGAGAAELGEADVRAALVGKSLRWWAEDGWLHGDLTFERDGSASITSENPAAADRGRWRFADGQICTVWHATRGGAEKCYFVRQVSRHRFVTTGGNVFEIVEPGA